MTESNVLDIKTARRKKELSSGLDELAIAKSFLSRKPLNPKKTFDFVKNQLRSRGIKYRLSFPELDLSGFTKNSLLIFPREKLIIEFTSKSSSTLKLENWTVETCGSIISDEPLMLVNFIINKIKELEAHGKTS